MAIADIRDEIAKVAGEQFGRKFGARIGSLGPLQKVGDTLRAVLGDDKLVHYGFSAGGILAAALLHAPDELAVRFSDAGYDGPKIQRWLNESIDAAVLSATAAIERGGSRTDAVQQAVAKSFDDKKDAFDDIFKSECIINSYDRTIHDLNCPMCWRGDREQGKADQRRKVANFLEGCRKVPLEWAVKNGYAPTKGQCCGNSAQETVQKYAKPSLTFADAVMNIEKTFKDDAVKKALVDLYFTWLTVATSAEQKRLHDLQAKKQWSPELAVRVLQTVRDTPVPAELPGHPVPTKAGQLITILGSFVKEKDEAVAVRAAKAVQSFLTGEEDTNAERIRVQIRQFARENEAAANRRRSDRLRDHPPRKAARLPNWLAWLRARL